MKRQHEVFALAYAKNPDPAQAYKEAYPKTTSDDGARVSGLRLLKRAEIQELIATNKKEIATIANTLVAQELKKERKRQFLTMADRREILYNIAHGKKFKTFDKNGKAIFRYPDDADRIKAIEVDMEITGEGFRPPEPQPGNTFNGPVYNTVVRKTVFKTRETTAKKQTFEIKSDE